MSSPLSLSDCGQSHAVFPSLRNEVLYYHTYTYIGILYGYLHARVHEVDHSTRLLILRQLALFVDLLSALGLPSPRLPKLHQCVPKIDQSVPRFSHAHTSL
jgi:hypothetical protein